MFSVIFWPAFIEAVNHMPVEALRGYNGARMNPLPAPRVQGSTEWERFDNAVRKVFSVAAEATQREKAGMEAVKAKTKLAKGATRRSS